MTYMERVLVAVNDDEWQAFRISMKGKQTWVKLQMLEDYLDRHYAALGQQLQPCADGECHYELRVDNYIKALCRGGQLHPKESLQSALEANWEIRIRR